MSMRRCPGKGGLGTLFVNGEKVRQGRIEATQCCGFSATEGADVGMNTGTPVSTDYGNPFRFNGKIEKVTIDLRTTRPKPPRRRRSSSSRAIRI